METIFTFLCASSDPNSFKEMVLFSYEHFDFVLKVLNIKDETKFGKNWFYLVMNGLKYYLPKLHVRRLNFHFYTGCDDHFVIE